MESVKAGVYEAVGIPHNLPGRLLGETPGATNRMLWPIGADGDRRKNAARQSDMTALFLVVADATRRSLLYSWPRPPWICPQSSYPEGHETGTSKVCRWDVAPNVWRLSEEVRAGTLSEEQFLRSESSMISSKGHCNTMGTASTMALLAEALGMTHFPDPRARPRSMPTAGELI